MTDHTDSDRPTSSESASGTNAENPSHSPVWKGDENEYYEPDTTLISDPPDYGADYYKRLIDLDTCSYAYLKFGSLLHFEFDGEIRDKDDFKDVLYELYKSTYHSNLSAADLRPKAFEAFADRVVADQLKTTLFRTSIEGPPGPHNQTPREDLNEPFIKKLHAAAALACEHRKQVGRRTKSKDAVLDSILPRHLQN
jgi:hypothetical protein